MILSVNCCVFISVPFAFRGDQELTVSLGREAAASTSQEERGGGERGAADDSGGG